MLSPQIWLLLSYALPLLPASGWRELDAALPRPCFDRLCCTQALLEVKVEPATEKEAQLTVSSGATFAPARVEEINDLQVLETVRWTNMATGRDRFHDVMRSTIRLPALEGTSGGHRSESTRRLPPGRYLIQARYEAAPAGRWRPLWTGSATVEVAPAMTREQAIEQLSKLAADDLLDDELTAAVQLVLWRAHLDESVFRAIGEIRALRRLDLTDLAVTDALLKHLGNLANLQRLALARTGVSGTTFSELSRMTSLREIDMTECQLAPGALTALADALPSLTVLSLRKATFPPEDARALTALCKLKRLDLAHCRLPDGWPASLARLSGLENIDLSFTAANDADVRALSHLERLTSLWLSHTQVTDRGIALLLRHPRLQSLSLIGTQVTADGSRKASRMPSLKCISVSGDDAFRASLSRLGLTVLAAGSEEYLTWK